MYDKRKPDNSAIRVIRDAKRRGKIAEPSPWPASVELDWLVLAVSWLLIVLVFLAVLSRIAQAL